ncbi:MAG: ANTAR domain-containing protein [Pseudomonadota bacterium]
MSETTDTDLTILVLDENPVRSAILESGLKEAGFSEVIILSEPLGLVDQIYKVDPDVVLIDLENPSRDMLEQMFQVSRAVRRPIAMFVDQADKMSIERAIEAGVSAYIVDGLKKERVKPILDMTMSRFRAFDRLQRELDEAKTALEERKVIDRAKGILMSRKNLSEADAYAQLRRSAMMQNRKIYDVALSLISAAELLE